MTLGGHKQSSAAVRYQNQLARKSKSTSCSQIVLNGRQTSEPIGKNAQIAVRVHKRSSTSDTCQNQLARMPKQHLMSQQFSTSDTHQNQLSRMSKQHYCSQIVLTAVRINWQKCPKALALTNGKVACVHTCGLTRSWRLAAHPKCKFPFHQEKH